MSATVAAPSFTFERTPLELAFRNVRLAAREWVTEAYVRVRLEGPELAGFRSEGCDDHLRIFFPDAAAQTVEELRASPSREYTPLTWGADWLELEFAVHGDEGIAAPWAATAEIGARAAIGGPRGSRVLHGTPEAWFLAGDETAVPAIRRFVALMPADAVGRIVIEVVDAAHELPLQAPTGVEVTYLHRGDGPSGQTLAAALDALGANDRPAGDTLGFIAAEQAIVKPGRALLLERWGLRPEATTVKGYWKRGEAEYHAPH